MYDRDVPCVLIAKLIDSCRGAVFSSQRTRRSTWCGVTQYFSLDRVVQGVLAHEVCLEILLDVALKEGLDTV